MKKNYGNFIPTPFERFVLVILGSLIGFGGLYVIGPWRLDEYADERSPLLIAFNNSDAVVVLGAVLIANGLAIMWTAFAKAARKGYTRLLSNLLLAGFLLRLYSLIAVLMVTESWRPPSYLSSAAIVVMLGAFWIWVNVNARPPK